MAAEGSSAERVVSAAPSRAFRGAVWRRAVDYLWSVAPEGASNSEIAGALEIRSHQTVYMVTQDLLRRNLVRAERRGREWVFYALEGSTDAGVRGVVKRPPAVPMNMSGAISPREFEALARRVMSEHFGVLLAPGSIPGVRKEFDLVSPDRRIVGDAKYYTLVRGLALPPGKFSVVAEHVWLLEKTKAPTRFLVFGNDRSVPTLWLKRYGNLPSGVRFYFLQDHGTLESLTPDADAP